MSKIIKNIEQLKEDVKAFSWNTYTFIDSTVTNPKRKSWISIYYVVNMTPQLESVIHVMARFSSESKDGLNNKSPRQTVLRVTDFPLFRED